MILPGYASKTNLKDPYDIDEYTVDWSDKIASGVAISTSAWEFSNDLVKVGSDTFSANATKIRFSGGTYGKRYTVTNKVVTDSGLRFSRSFDIVVDKL